MTSLLARVEADDPDLATFIWLAAVTGARRSQLLGLRWAEVDGRHAAIGFTRAYVEGPTGPVLRATKTHRTYRVAIDHETVARLSKHRHRAELRAREHGVAVGLDGFVFTSAPEGRQPWSPNWVTKRFVASLRRAGVGQFRLHDLRHFMATEMLARGCAIATVSQRLGHARASTTLNVYSHSIPGSDHDAADLIAGLLRAEQRPRDPEPDPGRIAEAGAVRRPGPSYVGIAER